MQGFAHFLGLNYGMHRAKQAEQQSNPLKGFNGGIEESLVNSEKAANEQIAANSGGIEESLVESGDTTIGQQPLPKYRVPTTKEADRAMDQMDAAAYAAGLLSFGKAGLVGKVAKGLTGITGTSYIFNRRDIEDTTRNTPWYPEYKNWDYEDWKGTTE